MVFFLDVDIMLVLLSIEVGCTPEAIHSCHYQFGEENIVTHYILL